MALQLCIFTILISVALTQNNTNFTSDFSAPDPNYWIEDEGIGHCDDICFEERPDHLTYNATDITDVNKTKMGLLSVLDDIPCVDPKTNKTTKGCCDSSGKTCARYAAGHLSSKYYHKYGRFEWKSVRVGHGDINNPMGPSNEFTCLSCYTDHPIHNEIAICVDYNSNQYHAAYWTNNTMNRRIVTLDKDVILAESYHDFHFEWTDKSLVYGLDDTTIWEIDVNDPKQVPFEMCNMRIILRPTHNETYQGPSYLFIEQYSYSTL